MSTVQFIDIEIEIDAIRARAIAAGGHGARWTARKHPSQEGRLEEQGGEVVVYDEGAPSAEQAAHIAGMDPATTLALLALIDDLTERQQLDE